MIDHKLWLLRRPKPTDWKGQPFDLAEYKLDGFRATIFRNAAGIKILGRKEYINLWDKVQRNTSLRKKIEDLPVNTILDGELWTSSAASDVVTRLNEGDIEFSVFAVPLYAGKDQRGMDLLGARLLAGALGFVNPRLVDPCKRTREYLLEEIKKRKIEGLVLKQDHWSLWYKLKPIATIDCVVTGWKGGSSKYDGKMGALLVSVLDGSEIIEIASIGGGFTDEQREWKKEDVIGRVCEVEYDSVTTGGRLRFPVFVKWRFDKPTYECTADQLHG